MQEIIFLVQQKQKLCIEMKMKCLPKRYSILPQEERIIVAVF